MTAKNSPKKSSTILEILLRGIWLIAILCSPLAMYILLVYLLDRFFPEVRLWPYGQMLGLLSILVSVIVSLRIIRKVFRQDKVLKWMAWIAFDTGLVLAIASALLFQAAQGIRKTSTIKTAQCRQMIAAIEQFCLEHPDRQWIYYNDIVGPGAYLSVHHDELVIDPTENFPLHRDYQDFVSTLRIGWKIIWWYEVPRNLKYGSSDLHVFAIKPDGKLDKSLSSRGSKSSWPAYLEWKQQQAPLQPPSVRSIPFKYTGSSRFLILYKEMSWEEAKIAAEELGGRLAVLDTRKKIDEVYGKRTQYVPLWIGLTDEVEEGNWLWINGQELEDDMLGLLETGPDTQDRDYGHLMRKVGFLSRPNSGMRPSFIKGIKQVKGYVIEFQP